MCVCVTSPRKYDFKVSLLCLFCHVYKLPLSILDINELLALRNFILFSLYSSFNFNQVMLIYNHFSASFLSVKYCYVIGSSLLKVNVKTKTSKKNSDKLFIFTFS